MRYRQVKNEAQPVDKKDLRPGDKVEYIGYAYVICPGIVDAFAVNLSVVGYTSMHSCADSIYRIEITGTKDGKLTWERIQAKPKAVEWDELKRSHWFMAESKNGHAYGPYLFTPDRVFEMSDPIIGCEKPCFSSLTLYRAEPVKVVVENGEPVIEWRVK